MNLKFKAFRKTVSTAGTREQLTTSDNAVLSVMIQALASNTSYVYVGDNTVSSTNGMELAAGGFITISNTDDSFPGGEISLKDIWIDVAVNGEGVSYSYIEP